MSTIGAGSSWAKTPFILKMIVSLSNLKYAFLDHGRQEDLLKKSSVDYTICRAPMLNDNPHAAMPLVTKEGEKMASGKLSRASAAECYLDIIENGKHIRETVHLANIE
jgi:hypothetical protein